MVKIYNLNIIQNKEGMVSQKSSFSLSLTPKPNSIKNAIPPDEMSWISLDIKFTNP
jgi:hypothetical protein